MHKNGKHRPIVGRLGASREAGTHQQFRKPCSTTMVRVTDSSGDSIFHPASLSEDVKIMIEPGMNASEEKDHRGRLNLKYPRLLGLWEGI